jgi:hypothetical protein
MLADVRVPLVGVGASGDVTGWGAIEVELCVVCLFVVSFLLDDFAATVNVANEKPAVHNIRAIRLRVVTKPEVGSFFFMMVVFGLAL